MRTYRVQIGDRTTAIRINPYATVKLVREGEVYPEHFIGGYHNYDGLRGVVVARAVEKLFGRRAFWFGEADDVSRGQVFEALRPAGNNSHPGNTALTPTVRLDVKEV